LYYGSVFYSWALKSFAGKPIYLHPDSFIFQSGSGIAISVSPTDRQKKGNGTTTVHPSYQKDTTVTLTAPSSASGNVFQKWKKDSSDYSTISTATVKMTANTVMDRRVTQPKLAHLR